MGRGITRNTDGHSSRSLRLPRADAAAEMGTRLVGTLSMVQVRLLSAVLPWGLLLVAIAGLAVTRDPGELMFASGLVAAALSLFAFRVLIRRIRETFEELWHRGIVEVAGEREGTGPLDRLPDPVAENAATSSMGREDFLQELDKRLNHPGQLPLAIAFALLPLIWLPFEDRTSPEFLVIVLLELLSAYTIGLMAWRMVMTGLHVRRLGKRHRVIPQLEHPDQCGGLEPLGNLCLWNALIVSVGGMYLGGWIIILGPHTPFPGLASAYRTLFSWLLVIPVVVAAIGFFLPLWSVHQIMVQRRAELRQQLAVLGRNIDRLAMKALREADRAESEQFSEIAGRLNLMRDIYRRNQRMPVWPFNMTTLMKFVTAQALPVIGLITQVVGLPFKALFG